MTDYITKTLPSGAVIKIPDPAQFPLVEPPEPQPTTKELQAQLDILMMMQLESEGIL